MLMKVRQHHIRIGETTMAETEQIARRVLALVDAHQVDAAASLCAPDARFNVSGMGDADLRTWKQFAGAMVAAVPDGEHRVTNAVEAGRQVFMEIRWHGTHTQPLQTPQGTIPATGRSIDLRICAVFEVDAGRLTAERGYFDQLEFLTQLGQMPAPATAGSH
jgi:steroid delta-isomerase-like uncharacterized protein